MLSQWIADLRHAGRALMRTPGFSITAIGTLALAIGAVAGMFSVVNKVLLQPLPFNEPERLVEIAGTAPGSDLPERFGLNNAFYLHYKENSKLLEGVFVYGGGTSTLRTENRVERIGMIWPSNDMYATLGVRPVLGRLPVAEDGDDVAVISDKLWNTWFNRDPSIIGKSYFVSDSMKQIIGVMPPEFVFPDERAMLWVATPVPLEGVNTGGFGANVVGRMKPGVTRERVAAELTGLSKQLPERFGGSPGFARIIGQHKALVDDLGEQSVGQTARKSLWVLLGSVVVVLLIACANVTNLFLVRAEGRRRDMAVRRAIGASRSQLVRLQMAEAFMIAVPAGVLAVMLSAAGLPVFLRAAPEGIPRLSQVGLDLTTIAAAFALVIAVALACGIVPSMRASSPDLTRLREGGRGATRGRQWGRDFLVIGQTALALVLLIGSALLVQSFQKLRNVKPGYEIKDIYTFQFAPSQPHLTGGPAWGQLHLNFMDKLRALPGVTAVGVVNNLPLDEGTGGTRFRTDDMSADATGTLVSLNFSGGDHFKALGMKLLQGRAFTNNEAVTPNSSIIVSRSAALKLFPDRNAIGQQMTRVGGNTPWPPFTIVGVVDDVKQDDWRQEGEAVVYLPLTGPLPTAWGMGSPAYVVKTARAGSIGPEVRELVRQIAPEAPVYREHTMEFLAERSMVQLSFTMLTLGVVSALALILGALGLYGVLSYVVAQRTREIGVRMALGATTGKVQRQVVTEGATIVAIGVVVGVVIAIASSKYLTTMLYEVKPVDPIVFALMSVMMLGVGMLASYVPARRASRVNPIESLRSD